jgi:nucleoside 2-deoxyribosyltransferase
MSKHITLCGSMTFKSEMKALADTLEAQGFTVTYPKPTEEEKNSGYARFTDYANSLGGIQNLKPTDPVWSIKRDGILAYKETIEKTDVVLICNFDKGDKKNYIGQNTFLEMGYAFFLDKKLFVLQEPPYGDQKVEEVLGMMPIFLNGDISNIKSYF